ncbi:MAG TPA: hypothetical protein DCY13_04770 [Verrucomicrobiales bacterium]|nr:hypothetical protein [Verrucomicrobiales bacterium]
MCTVTLLPRKHGFVLGMNRDESRARASGLPPGEHRHGRHRTLHPSEPGGGTWIAVTEEGYSFALINWYSVTPRSAEKRTSRGAVIPGALLADRFADADAAIAGLPLPGMHPFRLIGIDPIDHRVIEWRWDQQKLGRLDHAWRPQQWISSGHDEPCAQAERGRIFELARKQSSAGSLNWLRRLHRSHRPGRGPYSTCMHRAEAATVSYSEISVDRTLIRMRHASGSPCSVELNEGLCLKRCGI